MLIVGQTNSSHHTFEESMLFIYLRYSARKGICSQFKNHFEKRKKEENLQQKKEIRKKTRRISSFKIQIQIRCTK